MPVNTVSAAGLDLLLKAAQTTLEPITRPAVANRIVNRLVPEDLALIETAAKQVVHAMSAMTDAGFGSHSPAITEAGAAITDFAIATGKSQAGELVWGTTVRDTAEAHISAARQAVRAGIGDQGAEDFLDRLRISDALGLGSGHVSVPPSGPANELREGVMPKALGPGKGPSQPPAEVGAEIRTHRGPRAWREKMSEQWQKW